MSESTSLTIDHDSPQFLPVNISIALNIGKDSERDIYAEAAQSLGQDALSFENYEKAKTAPHPALVKYNSNIERVCENKTTLKGACVAFLVENRERLIKAVQDEFGGFGVAKLTDIEIKAFLANKYIIPEIAENVIFTDCKKWKFSEVYDDFNQLTRQNNLSKQTSFGLFINKCLGSLFSDMSKLLLVKNTTDEGVLERNELSSKVLAKKNAAGDLYCNALLMDVLFKDFDVKNYMSLKDLLEDLANRCKELPGFYDDHAPEGYTRVISSYKRSCIVDTDIPSVIWDNVGDYIYSGLRVLTVPKHEVDLKNAQQINLLIDEMIEELTSYKKPDAASLKNDSAHLQVITQDLEDQLPSLEANLEIAKYFELLAIQHGINIRCREALLKKGDRDSALEAEKRFSDFLINLILPEKIA